MGSELNFTGAFHGPDLKEEIAVKGKATDEMPSGALGREANHYRELFIEATPEEREQAMQLDALSFAEIGGFFKETEFANREEMLRHYNDAIRIGFNKAKEYANVYTSLGYDLSDFRIDVEAYLKEVDERVELMKLKQESAKQMKLELEAIGQAVQNTQDTLILRQMLVRALGLGANPELIQKINERIDFLSSKGERPVEYGGLAFLGPHQEELSVVQAPLAA